ncbi:MAG: helix-turn-helix domain-containing protein [Christensenellales bacterium]
MTFEQMLRNAKQGDEAALEQLLELYQPLLMKNSYVFGRFSPDCYQTLVERFLIAVHRFKIPDDLSEN